MLNESRHIPVTKVSGNVEYPSNIVVGTKSALVFDYTKTLGSANRMLHTDSSRRDISVLSLLLRRELYPLGLLCRLHDHCVGGSVTLVAGILPKLAKEREVILPGSDCLVFG